jgi:hypothetical protein
MAKAGNSVGRGRGLLADQGTADKRGLTPTQQSKGGGRLLSSDHNFLGKRQKGNRSKVKKNHGVIKGVPMRSL